MLLAGAGKDKLYQLMLIDALAEVSGEQYEQVMCSEPKSWTDYPTYKKRFERLRPLFFTLAKANLVPMSFFLKYCFPVKTSS